MLVGTSKINRASLLRLLRPPAMPRRAQARLGQRNLAVSAGVVMLATVVGASVALASSPDPAHKHHKGAAQRAAAYPPSYTLPVGTLIANGKLGKPSLTGDTGSAGVPKGTAAKPTVPTSQTPAQNASIATYRGGSGTLTPAGIATLALQAGCSSKNAVIATAVAMAESGGSPGAQGDVSLMNATWDWSAGLWQIRGLRAQRNTGQLRDSVANQDAAKNAAGMYTISSGCTSWGPWTTYTRGTYRQNLGIATNAVNYVVRYFNAHGHHYPTVSPPDPNAPIPSGGGGGGGGGGQAAAAPPPAAKSTAAARSSKQAAKPAPGATTPAAQQPAAGGKPAPAKSSPTPTPTKTKKRILPTKLPTLPKLPTPTLKLPLPSVSLPIKLP